MAQFLKLNQSLMISDNLKQVKSRIDSVQSRKKVELIAVSKTRSTKEIQEAVDAGQVHFGENYLQESIEKINFFKGSGLIWHFIGPIQSNKTSAIAGNFDWVHSVDRIKVATRLSDQRNPALGSLNVLIQVNVDREETKSGVDIENVGEIVSEIESLPNLSLRGFMTIPRPENSQNSFAEMKQLISKYPNLDSLSMGMSADLEIAIKNGANLVRVGTDIFGQRSYN
ncbi:YggS family pyridoxal phosphate-dependent enzyme [Pseudothioglobus sp. nBUS_23]|uniref:YggS family pyridoxal phosphate-dependent enzyme n=1 Tax=Pseudothioglobus sp. nBUS_23 TaxID=3395318 RepID=UPI003EBB5A83